MWGRTHLARKTIFLKALKVYSAGGTTNFISLAEMSKRQRAKKEKSELEERREGKNKWKIALLLAGYLLVAHGMEEPSLC